MDGGGSTDMTLAFALDALKSLADPNAVFNDARQEYVGVVSEKPTYVVTNFTRKHRIRQDFFSGPRGVSESLDNVGKQFDTDRHVFVGTTEEDREVAEGVDWEYVDVETAAGAADWEQRWAARRPTPSRTTTATTGPEATVRTVLSTASRSVPIEHPVVPVGKHRRVGPERLADTSEAVAIRDGAHDRTADTVRDTRLVEHPRE
jgi:ribonucleotide monophosphatase NagD (HAD superfamily)